MTDEPRTQWVADVKDAATGEAFSVHRCSECRALVEGDHAADHLHWHRGARNERANRADLGRAHQSGPAIRDVGGGPVTACDHNVIPIRIRFRARWICVRCDEVFSTPPPRHVLMDAETFAYLLSEES